jgi:hypothetical protein
VPLNVVFSIPARALANEVLAKQRRNMSQHNKGGHVAIVSVNCLRGLKSIMSLL